MIAFDAYKKYLAIKMHFKNNSYDYFKFKGQIKANRDSFESRKDKIFFQRLIKLYKEDEYENLLVSNMLVNSDLWIGEIINDTGKQNYAAWKKINQSLQYIFTEDMKYILDFIESNNLTFNDIFKPKPPWPDIARIGIHRAITLESFIIMNMIFNFIPAISKNISDDILWPDFKIKCLKYQPFIKIDPKKYKNVMKSIFL